MYHANAYTQVAYWRVCMGKHRLGTFVSRLKADDFAKQHSGSTVQPVYMGTM